MADHPPAGTPNGTPNGCLAIIGGSGLYELPGLTDTAQPRYGATEEELLARAATIICRPGSRPCWWR